MRGEGNTSPLGMKYHNKKITYNGEQFDSKKEFRRYCELVLLQKANEITNLQRQVVFELVPAQYEYYEECTKNGKIKQKQRLIERPIKYIADFVYIENNGNMVVEDTKGYKSKEYIIKRKLMMYVHNIKIKEL